ncbi:MAG: hypothetical protein MJ231_00980 [bacterium]|nr:hypothetical protein [bacterium]
MRLYPLSSISYQSNCVGKISAKQLTKRQGNSVSFRGLEAGAKGVVGTLAGLGLGTLLTIGSGGILAPLLLSMGGCAAGCIKGSMDESAKDESDDFPYDGPTDIWV